MKLLLKTVAVLLWVGIGVGVSEYIPTSNYVEVLGEIVEVDKLNSNYTVKIKEDLVTVETNLPLPEPNKQIIILLPK